MARAPPDPDIVNVALEEEPPSMRACVDYLMAHHSDDLTAEVLRNMPLSDMRR